MLSVYSISTYVQDLKNKTIYTVALSMFNINLRSRSEELNYIPLHTLFIFNINLRSISEELNYIHLLTISILNINLRSRSEEQNYLHNWSQYIQYQPTFKIWGTKLFKRLALSMFNINLHSRSEVLNNIHLLTIKIFNINLRSRSEELNYIHGCSQYVQYQPTFKIWGAKLYTSGNPQ